jgi:threonine dehydrogenase-like Zn-dependent dehydrogenase
LAAIRKTKLEIGESALVMGLGILGIFAVQELEAAGAYPIIAADPVKERREFALKMGADYAVDPTEADFAKTVDRLSEGGVSVCIEVTGLGIGLIQALDCMREMGRVALLGCTRSSKFEIDYYGKVHGRGITMIGAHTIARPQTESSAGLWTDRDDIKTLLLLAKSGRVNFKDMISEKHSPEAAQEVYDRLASEKNFPIGVLFDWRKI